MISQSLKMIAVKLVIEKNNSKFIYNKRIDGDTQKREGNK